MPATLDPLTDFSAPRAYQIRLKGHLRHEWAGWFGGQSLTLQENGETLLTTPAIDQAALYGLLKKVRDVGLALIAVNPLAAGQEAGPGAGAITLSEKDANT